MECNVENQELERFRNLEKKLNRADNFFAVSILTSIVAALNLVQSAPDPTTYDVIASLGSIPLVYGAFLNDMYYKTEEYINLSNKYSNLKN